MRIIAMETRKKKRTSFTSLQEAGFAVGFFEGRYGHTLQKVALHIKHALFSDEICEPDNSLELV